LFKIVYGHPMILNIYCIFLLNSFVLYFNFEGVSHILRYYIHAYECTISNKFEIRTKKNSRGIYNIYSISSDDHIQF
jgi:hypothetical protein